MKSSIKPAQPRTLPLPLALAGFAAASLALNIVHAQSFDSNLIQPGRAVVFSQSAVGTLANGMVAVTLPTQIMTDGRVQILLNDYRVITLAPGQYVTQGTAVYAMPSVLTAQGYPANLLPTDINMRTPADRKTLGYIPPVGTTFSQTNTDTTFGTLGIDPNSIQCESAGTTQLASLSGDVAFDTDQSAIKSSFRSTLNSLAQQMVQRPNSRFTVTGHTDSRGSTQYNQSLSERRAQSVVQYLASQGVPASSLTSRGAGESQPIASNDTATGRAENRRVTISEAQIGGGGITTANCQGSAQSQQVQTYNPLNVDTRFTTTTVTTPTFGPMVQGPAAIYIGPVPGGAPLDNSAFIPQSTGGITFNQPAVAPTSTATTTTTTTSTAPTAAAEGEESSGGIGGVFSSIPWWAYAGMAAVAGLVGYSLIAGNGTNATETTETN